MQTSKSENKNNVKAAQSEAGYTLIELVIVCMIIGILATMSITLVSRARMNARESAAVATLNSLAGAWESYWARNGVYPHWGEGQQFEDPYQLFRSMVNDGYLPRAYSILPYDENTNLIYRITNDYALEIYEFDDAGGTRGESDYYWLLLHPLGFQTVQGYLGIGTTPVGGKIAVRPRLGSKRGDIDDFEIYGMQKRD